MFLAVSVAITHGMQLGFGTQPHLGHTGLGELAVDAFFVLSGFLLVGSYLRLRSIRRYTWHRFLRIMPGFWVCLLVTGLMIAPAIAWLQGLRPDSVFRGEGSALHFLGSNSMLMMREFGVSGLPIGVPEPGVLNGSLWTLFYEACCYAGVIGLGVVGALKHRPSATLGVVALLWVMLTLASVGIHLIGQERAIRFALVFLIGTLFWLYADRIPMRADLAALALVLLIASLLLVPDYRTLGAPALAYLCLWLTVIRPPAWTPRSDFSYGLYVYHWPVLQILVVGGVPTMGVVPYLGTAILLALGAAFLSWDYIESPAMRFKNARWVDPRIVSNRRGTATERPSRTRAPQSESFHPRHGTAP